jgi:hypothetical protein
VRLRTSQCPDATSDRQLAGGELGWSYGPHPAPGAARSQGMGDAFRRSHHGEDRALKRDPFGRQAAHFAVFADVGAGQGASWNEVVTHGRDRSRDGVHPQTSG